MIAAAYPQIRLPDLSPQSPDWNTCIASTNYQGGTMSRLDRYRFLDQYLLLLIQRNVGRMSIFWFPSQDDRLLIDRLQQFGPIMNVAADRTTPSPAQPGTWHRIEMELLPNPFWSKWRRLRQQLGDDYKNLSVSLIQKSQLDQARMALQHALRIEPHDQDAKLRLQALPSHPIHTREDTQDG